MEHFTEKQPTTRQTIEENATLDTHEEVIVRINAALPTFPASTHASMHASRSGIP